MGMQFFLKRTFSPLMRGITVIRSRNLSALIFRRLPLEVPISYYLLSFKQ
jgi:hypothetical protein